MKQPNFSQFLVTILIALLFCACDTFKDEVAPATDIQLTGQEVFVLSNGNTIIDMQGLVKTTQQVRVEITSQPAKGNLSEIQKGFVQYTSLAAARGTDGFNISIFSARENTLLKKDTVKIVIGDNPTDAPGLYAQGDEVYGVNGSIDIYPLKNDIIPFDPSLIRIVIWRPATTDAPYNGTAQVIDNKIIRYTPGPNFTVDKKDKMLYKIYNVNDTTQVSFAGIYLTTTTCKLEAVADNFEIIQDPSKVVILKINLNILDNDLVCGTKLDMNNIRLYSNPVYGNLASSNDFLTYQLAATVPTNTVDSLSYAICVGDNCSEPTTVKIKIK
jgi:hypothetical protein